MTKGSAGLHLTAAGRCGQFDPDWLEEEEKEYVEVCLEGRT